MKANELRLARSRKRKDFVKVLELAAKIAELRSKLHKIEEKHYHKLAQGGTVYGKCNLQGGEMTPYDKVLVEVTDFYLDLLNKKYDK